MVKSDIDFLASLEEISWRQKSKALFIKEGDNNTRFFHRIANSHRQINQIRGVEVDGVLFEEESDVMDQVVDFYKRLYQELETWRPTIDGLEFACLDKTERSMLERERLRRRRLLRLLRKRKAIRPLGQMGLLWRSFRNDEVF